MASNPQSQIQNPQSGHPRRAVPLTFSPIINDEANILAAIARGDRTLPDLAEEHATTVTALGLWLQREDIQRKLADLTTAGATLTRIAAVNQLPKAVSALSFQIDGYIFDRTHNLIKPGLDADRVAALRDANVRKAAHLMLRLAKFDPNQPVYRRRERSPADSSTLAPQGFAQRGEGGGVASAQHEPVRGVLNTPAPSASSSPALLSAPIPDILDLCFSTLAANAPQSSRTPEPETRSPIPTLTSHIPSPTSDIDERSAASTSPKGEVPAQPGVGAPAFSPGFASVSSSDFTSHIPLPTSDFDERSAASTSPKGEVGGAPKATEGAPALSPGFASVSSSDFTSHIPSPTSNIDERAPAFPAGFAPAFPTSSSFCLSHIPLPTSDFEPDPKSEPAPEPSLANSS